MYSPCTFGSIYAADVGSFFSVDYCEGRLSILIVFTCVNVTVTAAINLNIKTNLHGVIKY